MVIWLLADEEYKGSTTPVDSDLPIMILPCLACALMESWQFHTGRKR